MKTFKIIQRIAAGSGLIVALKCVDSLQPTNNELLGGMTLVVVCCLAFIGEVFYKESKEQDNI